MRSENRSPFLTAVPRDVISTGRSRTLILLIVDTPHTRVHRVYTCAWLSSMDTYVPFVHASTYVRIRLLNTTTITHGSGTTPTDI